MRELPRIALADALAVLQVMAETGDPRFERAAARFAARVTLERHLNVSQALGVLGLAAGAATPKAVAPRPAAAA